MAKYWWFGAVVAVVAVAAQGSATANGRGGFHPLVHAGAVGHVFHGAFASGGAARRTGRPMPGTSGVVHQSAGTRPYATAFGHLDTAAPIARAGARPWGDRYRFGIRASRFWRERRLAYWPRVGGGGPSYGGFGGTYGGGYGEADAGSYPVGSGEGPPYAEPTVASAYAEPPLGPSPYGGEAEYGDAPAAYYPGTSPQVIVIDNRARPPACQCRPARRVGPVVYRFGVGSPN